MYYMELSMRLKEVERPSSGFDNLDDRDVPCALCRRRGHSSVLMIPVTLLFYLLNTFATCNPCVQNSIHL